MRGPRYYLLLSIIVAEMVGLGSELTNSKVGYFMVRALNFKRHRFPTYLKVAFNNCLDLKSPLILVKLHVVMDLLPKTIIMLPIIILDSKHLPCNLKEVITFTITFNDMDINAAKSHHMPNGVVKGM